jgi:hypothetical protein
MSSLLGLYFSIASFHLSATASHPFFAASAIPFTPYSSGDFMPIHFAILGNLLAKNHLNHSIAISTFSMILSKNQTSLSIKPRPFASFNFEASSFSSDQIAVATANTDPVAAAFQRFSLIFPANFSAFVEASALASTFFDIISFNFVSVSIGVHKRSDWSLSSSALENVIDFSSSFKLEVSRFDNLSSFFKSASEFITISEDSESLFKILSVTEPNFCHKLVVSIIFNF